MSSLFERVKAKNCKHMVMCRQYRDDNPIVPLDEIIRWDDEGNIINSRPLTYVDMHWDDFNEEQKQEVTERPDFKDLKPCDTEGENGNCSRTKK